VLAPPCTKPAAGCSYENGNPVYDEETTTLHVVFKHRHDCPNPGDCARFMVVRSTDDGRSFSPPQVLSTVAFGVLHKNGLCGPAGGLQLGNTSAHPGRLLLCCNVDGEQPPFLHDPHSGGALAIYSDDHGKTWQRGKLSGDGNPYHLGECQYAEVPALDGYGPSKPTLAMTARPQYELTPGYPLQPRDHTISLSTDSGMSFGPPKPQAALPMEMRGIEGSLLSVPGYGLVQVLATGGAVIKCRLSSARAQSQL
jgi:hypothetical protein